VTPRGPVSLGSLALLDRRELVRLAEQAAGAAMLGSAAAMMGHRRIVDRAAVDELLTFCPTKIRGGEEMARVKPNRKTAANRSRSRKGPVRTQSGVEVTPDVRDALVEEAEEGYDLSKAQRRRTGRPSLGAGGPSPRVTFRAGPELYRAAQARARREGRTMSDLAREAFAKYIGDR
jgi:hypothetical protein